MKKLRPRFTYANVVSTLCLFLLLGGGAYAAAKLPANSIGTKQLKNNAVTAVKIKNGTISGSKINLASLGTVPDATHADTATTAAAASSASNSAQLGGAPAADYRDRCPAGTNLVAPRVCATGEEGADEYLPSVETCGELGLQLPTAGEARLIFPKTNPEHPFWTDDFWVNGTTSFGLVFWGEKKQLFPVAANGYYWIYCVTTPTNS